MIVCRNCGSQFKLKEVSDDRRIPLALGLGLIMLQDIECPRCKYYALEDRRYEE